MPATTRKKCFSKCRKRKESECGPNICKYINGKKYQYCRLGYKHKMDANCNIIKRKTRKKKLTKKKARNEIMTYISKRLKSRKQNNNIHAASKIKKFMKQKQFKIKSNYLQSLCSDSGVCLVFGNKSKDIKRFFHHFIHFDFAKSPLKMIGNPSENGFVNEIVYKREKYHAYSIMKSSTKETADNLFYEYLVGLYINKLNKRFPCFLETYGIFKYKDEDSWKRIKETDTKTISSFNKAITLLNNDTLDINSQKFNDIMVSSCLESKYMAIMIQHLNGVISIGDLIYLTRRTSLKELYNSQLIQLLFQIYFPLSILQNNFTHFDLHHDNVLLFEPNRNKYITFHYELSPGGEVVTFKSNYIAKMIDYGRSYFKDEDSFDSKQVHKKLCSQTSCDPACGTDYGYSWLSKSTHLRNQYYIYPYEKNTSHDLRLLQIIGQIAKSSNINKTKRSDNNIFTFLKKVRYNQDYGTPGEQNNSYPSQIRTVNDALSGLKELITSTDYLALNNEFYEYHDKSGDLYIYADGSPMQFVST